MSRVIDDYVRRTAHYWPVEWVEVDSGAKGRSDPLAVMSAEADRILARIPDGARVVALTRVGKGMTSRGLSTWLEGVALHGRDAAFVIGGAFRPRFQRARAGPIGRSPSPR